MSAAVPNDVLVTDSPAPGDAQLVERFVVAGDHLAFAELVRRHSNVVLGVCRRVLHDANDIDDVFQATFLVFVRDAARVRKRASLASWLYGVAYRLALRVARQKQRRRETMLVDDTLVDEDIFGKLANQHDQQLLDAELNALPDRYRQPLVLRYLAGKSPSEIAIELGVTVGAVEGLLRRSKDELRTRLLRRGVTLSATLGAALVTFQFSQQAAQAAGTEALIEATIQAGLAWNIGTNNPFPDLMSDRAVELAGKEIIAMTATTKTAIAIGLTVGGLVAGLGGVSLLSNSGDGTAEAAGFVSTILVAQEAGQGIEQAAFTTEPAAKNEAQASATSAPASPASGDVTIVTNLNLNTADAAVAKWDFKTRSSRVQKIEKGLLTPAEVDFNDIPLKDALDYIESTYQMDIVIDAKPLADEGISTDAPVNLKLSGVTVKDVLRLLLDPLLLDHVIKNDVLMVTTQTTAKETLETRVYNIGRLPSISPKDLAETITEMVAPDSWNLEKPKQPANEEKQKDGSPAVDPTMGNIRALDNMLVIRQTHRIHGEIVELLNQFEQQSNESKTPGKPLIRR